MCFQYIVLSTGIAASGCNNVCPGDSYCMKLNMDPLSGYICNCQSGYKQSDSGCTGTISTNSDIYIYIYIYV